MTELEEARRACDALAAERRRLDDRLPRPGEPVDWEIQAAYVQAKRACAAAEEVALDLFRQDAETHPENYRGYRWW